MPTFSVTLKGEYYITVEAEDECDAYDVAQEKRKQGEGYFKVRDTDIDEILEEE